MQLMEQHPASHGFPIFSPPDSAGRAGNWDHPVDNGQSPSQTATPLPFTSRITVPEGIGDFESTPMSMAWPQQFPAATPNISSPTTVATNPRMLGQQHAALSIQWLQASIFGAGSIWLDSLEPGLSQPTTGPWDLNAPATNVNGCPLQPSDVASYPLAPPEPEFGNASSSAYWHHDDSAKPGQYWSWSTSEYGSGQHTTRQAELSYGGGEKGTWQAEGQSRLIQAGTPGANVPRYVPIVAEPGRDPGPDTTSMQPKTPHYCSATPPAITTNDTDKSHLSPTSDTTTTPASPATTTTTTREPTLTPRTRRASTSTSTSASTSPSTSPTAATTTTSSSSFSCSKPTRNRNRAAASRYRAKTQAAWAQLAASEREVRVRHESLLACADQLRQEVFWLKSELLRHAGAGCEDPLIRGFLKSAAEEVWVTRVRAGSEERGLACGREEEEARLGEGVGVGSCW